MTVYVDDMYKYPAGQFRNMKMSHMVADDEQELHAMAQAIGVARRWYQGDHYDICLAMRAKAVQRGAIQVAWRTLGCMVVRRRRTGNLGKPEDAVAWMRNRGKKNVENQQYDIFKS